jgi:hypothetical protein
MVKEMSTIISQENKVNEDDVSLFDNFLERAPLPVMPTTSTSFDTAQKKFRSKHQQYHIMSLK